MIADEGNGCFPATQWTLIHRLRSSDAKVARRALDDLCAQYYYPLYCYIRRRGFDQHDAEDALQDFFSKLLRLDRIDLYQLHTIDARVPLEESIGELARLQAEGKIRHIGVSNVTVPELERARRLVKVVSVQNRYNVADRSSQDVLAVCERDGLAFIPWSPLVQGDRDRASPRRAALEDWGRKRGLSIHQAAIAWLLNESPAMLPIPGTSKVPHLESNLAAALAARELGRDLPALG